ncbi:MAG TPA: Ig-like domain-containing protein [Nevskiaceae bacterium]|nr:Ig-like domain-containing protein [Nevskiaceae bacterium]
MGLNHALAVLVAAAAGTAWAAGDAPLGVGDHFATQAGNELLVPGPGVVANDLDTESDPITVRLQQVPNRGTLMLWSRGGFRYTPDPGFEGYDQFRYEPFDGETYGAPTTVILRVNGRPRTRPDSYGLLAGQAQLTVEAPGILGNDTDSGGDVLSVTLSVPPKHGTLELTPDGGFFYFPDAGYVGRDSFTYRAHDDELASRETTVRLRVVTSNQAPVAGEDTFQLDEDTPITVVAPGVLANDSDPDGDRVRVVLGEAQLEGLDLRADGSFDFWPPQDVDGDQYFTYRVTDGITTSAPQSVRLDIQAINDPPSAEGEQYEVEQGGVLVVPAPGVLANDADTVEFDGVQAVGPLTGPFHGRLTLNPDGSFRYRPKAGYRGPDQFTYQAWDSQAGGVAGVEIVVQPHE